jgi:hypothetical protein
MQAIKEIKWAGFKPKNHEQVPASVAKSELDRIRDERGADTAEIVVEEAAKPASPLHTMFTWDDTEAAHLWRLEEARSLMRAITIEFADGTEVRAFHAITINENTQADYVPLEIVQRSEQLSAQVLERALSELDAWTERYQVYSELLPLATVVRHQVQKARAKVPA